MQRSGGDSKGPTWAVKAGKEEQARCMHSLWSCLFQVFLYTNEYKTFLDPSLLFALLFDTLLILFRIYYMVYLVLNIYIASSLTSSGFLFSICVIFGNLHNSYYKSKQYIYITQKFRLIYILFIFRGKVIDSWPNLWFIIEPLNLLT